MARQTRSDKTIDSVRREGEKKGGNAKKGKKR